MNDEDGYEDETYDDSPQSARQRAEAFVRTAVLFECGLALVAIGLGWLFDIPAWISQSGESGNPGLIAGMVGLGIVGTIPLLGFFFWLEWSESNLLGDLREVVESKVVPLFREATVLELGLISLAAGVGEEALFRGFLQTALQAGLGADAGPVLPILLASLIFGLAHYISHEYMVLTTLMGVYMGVWFWWTGDLIVPMVIHFLYDWFALTYMKYNTEPVADES
ncbi:MAG: CPBP family intramembrane glutamic endopeptidase [Pirellulaceae bacterium]